MQKPVLVVDDDPDIRQVLQDRLESYGYPVETASDGRTALEMLEWLTPRGVFLDIRMPGMEGIELLAPEHLPVVRIGRPPKLRRALPHALPDHVAQRRDLCLFDLLQSLQVASGDPARPHKSDTNL